MKKLISTIFVLLSLFLTFYAQDSDQKQDILSARKSEKEKEKRRIHCQELGNEAIRHNDCYEIYPNDIMTWGKGFSNGLAKITVDGKAGFINNKGEVAIQPKLKDAGQFSENLAPFEDKNGKWGYINTNGEVTIKPEFDWAISFHEGLGLIQVGKLWGYIDKNGKIVIEPKFEEASSFSEGTAVVGYYDKNYVWTTHQRANGKWQRRFIDKNGNWLIDKDFDGISRNFNGGMAIVSRSLGYSEKFKGTISETYIIDQQGNELWKLNTWYISWFSDDVIIVAVGQDKEGKDAFSFVDRNGKRMTDITFSSLSDFSEGISAARVTWTGKFGFINKSGDFVIEPKFEWAHSFSEGLASAEERFEGYGFIDKTGKWIIKPQFRWVSEFKEGFALVVPKGDRNIEAKTGYIDKQGNYIWKPTK